MTTTLSPARPSPMSPRPASAVRPVPSRLRTMRHALALAKRSLIKTARTP
jgi:oleandomycin transport system permease protein